MITVEDVIRIALPEATVVVAGSSNLGSEVSWATRPRPGSPGNLTPQVRASRHHHGCLRQGDPDHIFNRDHLRRPGVMLKDEASPAAAVLAETRAICRRDHPKGNPSLRTVTFGLASISTRQSSFGAV